MRERRSAFIPVKEGFEAVTVKTHLNIVNLIQNRSNR
jgi:hypothetical protein